MRRASIWGYRDRWFWFSRGVWCWVYSVAQRVVCRVQEAGGQERQHWDGGGGRGWGQCGLNLLRLSF